MTNTELTPGQILRELRLKSSRSLSSVAVILGVSKNMVSVVENGKRNLPKGWIPKLAVLFSVSEATFLRHDIDSFWLKERVPHGAWQDVNNLRKYFEWLLNEKFKFNNINDLYRLRRKDIKDNYGAAIFNYYDSFEEAIIFAYPERAWDKSLFHNKNKMHTTTVEDKKPIKEKKERSDPSPNITNIRRALEQLAKILNFENLDDFYPLRIRDIPKNIRSLIRLRWFRGSIRDILRFAYPEYDWLEWKFPQVISGFWDDQRNINRYVIWLGKILKFSEPENPISYYKVTASDFDKNHGSGLISLYNSSPYAVLKLAFPDYKFLPWLFNSGAPQKFWHNVNNRIEYLKWFEDKLNIKDPYEWYNITREDFRCHYGASMINSYGRDAIFQAVSELYPDLVFDKDKFERDHKRQKLLFTQIVKWLHMVKVEYNYPFIDEQITFEMNSNQIVTVDVYIPELRLAFEYQGEQHYKEIQSWGGSKTLAKIQGRDQEKRKILESNDITIIDIHYSWDGSVEMLKQLVSENKYIHELIETGKNNPEFKSTLSFMQQIDNEYLTWFENYRDISMHQTKHSDLDLLKPALTKWLARQRIMFFNKKLRSDKYKLLQKIGITFDDYIEKQPWDVNYKKLEKFKENKNHCNVSQQDKENLQLGRWANKQRQILPGKSDSESLRRIKLLDELGFCWHIRASKWDKKIKAIIQFVEINGHGRLPSRFPIDGLGEWWVFNLRQDKKKGKLREWQINELSKIGFCWVINDELEKLKTEILSYDDN